MRRMWSPWSTPQARTSGLSLARERMRYGESDVVKRALERGMDPNINAKGLDLVHLAVL